MRVLLFSDLHGHAFKPCSTTLENGRNSRLQDAVNVLTEIYDACGMYEVDGVLFGGDLFHARGTLQVATFNAIFEGIAKIKTRVEFFGMLVGNHDQATKLGNIHACYAFDSILTVMDKTQWYCFEDSQGEQLHVYGIPHTIDKEQIEQDLKSFGSDQPVHSAGSICLAHVGISGAKVGSNFVMITEDNPTTIPFTRAGFNQIFLGHYHQPQMLAPNMRYIGATHQHNWGDVGQDRGFLIYDTDTDTVEPVEIESAPKFVKIEGFPDGRMKWSGSKPPERDNIVRVVFTELPAPDVWATMKQTLLDDGAKWVEQWVEPTVAQPLDSENVYQPGMDFEDMIESFVTESEIGDLDEELLIKIGKKILRGVQ
jgi:DNA repair exonuclease SbcCD nuclease subunit